MLTPPRTAGWMLPRGQGKSTLVAALGVYELFCGGEGAVVVWSRSTSVRPASSSASPAAWSSSTPAVEPGAVFREIWSPERDAPFHCLPAEPKRLEGLDYSLAILDEIGVIARDTYEVMNLAQGKREPSTLIGIGTPGPDPHNSVWPTCGRRLKNPDDESLVWREFSAAGFEDHPLDCQHCWEIGNPALDDFLPATPCTLCAAEYPRGDVPPRRLCQFVRDTDGKFLPAGVWDGLSRAGHPGRRRGGHRTRRLVLR